jgi:hypothetical protein
MGYETYCGSLAARLLFFLPTFAEFGRDALNETGELIEFVVNKDIMK